jgi:hypothetical protein
MAGARSPIYGPAKKLSITAYSGRLRNLSEGSCSPPLLVARHLLPFEGGANFDLHAHLVGQVKPNHGWAVQEYLAPIFGSDRIWISSVRNPGERRSFSGTSNYPVWRQVNQDWNEVDNDNLKEFFEQSSGLRSVDALGPLRDFRTEMNSSSEAATGDDSDHSPDAEIFDGGQSPDEVDARVSSAEPNELFETGTRLDDDDADREGQNRGAAAGDISSFLASDTTRRPILYGCHFAWIGLTRRFVAQVGDYTTFEELQQHYDLDASIAFAQRHVEDTHAYLFKPVIHEKSFEPTTKVTGSQPVGKGRPTAEPPRAALPLTPASGRPDLKGSHPWIGLPGFTIELTVQAERGPATTTLRVQVPELPSVG